MPHFPLLVLESRDIAADSGETLTLLVMAFTEIACVSRMRTGNRGVQKQK